ncbi:MAG TPA: BTAD domain-containing putative transcriptional regulator, partial [Clostridia bacterium]|nr:BTAD domain-containing putative transcriptional regulator [Clostridia bacterium]
MEAVKSVLQVNMLGEFSIVCGERKVDDQSSRSKKVWTLIQYLIANRMKDISQNDLIEVLWPEGSEIGDPANTLKTIVHRARQAMDTLEFEDGKNIILYRSGTYAWNNDLTVEVDAEEFLSCCDVAERATGDKKLAHLMRALSYYRGDYLPKASFEAWAMPLGSYFRTRYIQAVHEAVAMLTQAGRYGDIISLCRRASVIDPYDESVHFALIQALVATGAQQEAM